MINIRADMAGIRTALPIFKVLVRLWLAIEDRFTTLVWTCV